MSSLFTCLLLLSTVYALSDVISKHKYCSCLRDSKEITHMLKSVSDSDLSNYSALTTVCSLEFPEAYVLNSNLWAALINNSSKSLMSDAEISTFAMDRPATMRSLFVLLQTLFKKHNPTIPTQETEYQDLLQTALGQDGLVEPVKILLTKTFMFDSLSSVETGSPYSESANIIAQWPLGNIRNDIVNIIGSEAYLSAIETFTKWDIGSQDVDVFLMNPINLAMNSVLTAVSKLSVNFVCFHKNFIFYLTDILMLMLRFDENEGCSLLFKCLSSTLQDSLRLKANEIRLKCLTILSVENITNKEIYSAVSEAFTFFNDEKLLDEFIVEVANSLPEGLVTQHAIYEGLMNIKPTSNLSRTWKFVIYFVVVMVSSTGVVILYRFVTVTVKTKKVE